MRRLNLKHGLAVLALFLLAPMARAQTDDVTRQLAHDTFKQLIEINTTDSVGSTTVAAEAMAQRGHEGRQTRTGLCRGNGTLCVDTRNRSFLGSQRSRSR